MAISITVNVKPAVAGIDKLTAGLRDRATTNRQVAAQFYGWVIRDYDAGGALRPTGPWAPLAPRTVIEKLREGWSTVPLGPRSGHLRMSFLPFADNDSAGVGARASFDVDYAEVHELGAPARNIPARPMLPPESIALDYVQRIYDMHVKVSIKRSGLA